MTVTSEESSKKQNTGILSSRDMLVKLIVIIGIAGAGLIFLSSVLMRRIMIYVRVKARVGTAQMKIPTSRTTSGYPTSRCGIRTARSRL